VSDSPLLLLLFLVVGGATFFAQLRLFAITASLRRIEGSLTRLLREIY